MKTLAAFACALFLFLVIAASAQALTFDFGRADDANTIGSGSVSEKLFTVDGVTLTAQSATFDGWSATPAGAFHHYASTGLGIDSGRDDWSQKIDGSKGGEVVLLNFSKMVKLVSLTFTDQDFEDDVSILTKSTVQPGRWVSEMSFPLDELNSTLTLRNIWRGYDFGIGALAHRTEFTLAAIEVELVPLPAAFLLLLGALGGFALIHRGKAI